MSYEALAGVLFDAALRSFNPALASDGLILSPPAWLSPTKLGARSASKQAFCRCLPVRLSGGFLFLGLLGFLPLPFPPSSPLRRFPARPELGCS